MKKPNIISSALLFLGISLMASVLKKSSSQPPVMLQDRESVAKWLQKMGVQNYTISDKLEVSVLGNVDLVHKKLAFLPVQFKNVSGNFNISNNRLTSMVGMPTSVGGNFNCSYNKITSLEHGPKEVGQWYECDNNRLTSLTGAPHKINIGFNCSHNKLKSLLGSPEQARGYYFCNSNYLETLEGFPTEGRANQKLTITNNKAPLPLFDSYYDKETKTLNIPVWDIIQKNAALKQVGSPSKYKH